MTTGDDPRHPDGHRRGAAHHPPGPHRGLRRVRRERAGVRQLGLAGAVGEDRPVPVAGPLGPGAAGDVDRRRARAALVRRRRRPARAGLDGAAGVAGLLPSGCALAGLAPGVAAADGGAVPDGARLGHLGRRDERRGRRGRAPAGPDDHAAVPRRLSAGTVPARWSAPAWSRPASRPAWHLAVAACVVRCSALRRLPGVPAAVLAATASRRPSGAARWRPGASRARCVVGLLVLAFAFAEGSANDWLAVAVVDGYGVSHAAGVLVFARVRGRDDGRPAGRHRAARPVRPGAGAAGDRGGRGRRPAAGRARRLGRHGRAGRRRAVGARRVDGLPGRHERGADDPAHAAAAGQRRVARSATPRSSPGRR